MKNCLIGFMLLCFTSIPAFGVEEVKEEQSEKQTVDNVVTTTERIINTVCEKTGVATEKVLEGFNLLAKEYQLYGIIFTTVCGFLIVFIPYITKRMLKKMWTWTKRNDWDMIEAEWAVLIITVIIISIIELACIIYFFDFLAIACAPRIEMLKFLMG